MTLEAEKRLLFDYKNEALAMASNAAAERGDGIQPTMTDYFIAATKLGEQKAEEMAARGVKWTPAVFSDLSSLQKESTGEVIAAMHISGFQINKTDMEPADDMKMYATLKAAQLAQSQGRKAGLVDMLQSLQEIQQSGEKPLSSEEIKTGIEALKDSMDLDGDHAVNDFYTAVGHHAKFSKTVFDRKTNFNPAGTLMRDDENGVAITDGAQFNDVVFDGMGSNDVLTLNRGTYNNITLANIKKGTVEIADNTTVRGMNVSGLEANFSIGAHSLVSGMIVDEHTRFLHFDMEKGATIAHSDLRNAIITPSSHLRETNWTQVQTNGSFRDVDMGGTKFTGVTFDGSELNGASFKGASFKNVEFLNINVANLDLSGVRDQDINGLKVNGQDISSVKDLEMMKLAIGVKSFAWNPNETAQQTAVTEPAIGNAAALTTQLAAANQNDTLAALARAQEVLQVNEANNGANPLAAARAAMLASGVIGGESVSNMDIALTTQVAILERTVPEAEKASGANMQRDKSG